MFNAANLLGTLLQQRSTPSAGNRLETAVGQGGGPLGGLLSQLGGAGGGVLGSLMGALSGTGRDPDAEMQRLKDMARQTVSSPGREIAANNPLAIGGLGALAGTLLGGGRGAVGGGLLAVLGSLAYSALQPGMRSLADEPAQTAGDPAQTGGGPAQTAGDSGGYGRPAAALAPALTEADVQHKSLLMLRSMIQAAKADGQVDAAEIERITGKIEGDGPEAAEARAFVFEQMRGPADIDSVARVARTPVEAAEAYSAALMAIEVDTQAERDYLDRLAKGLGLQPDVVARLHAALGLPGPSLVPNIG